MSVATVIAALGGQGTRALESKPPSTAPATQWPTYNNGYKGQRFSALSDISASNVGSLKEVCRLKLADGGSLHTGPVVVGGTMYVTTPLDTFALDPASCKVRWKSSYQPEEVQV